MTIEQLILNSDDIKKLESLRASINGADNQSNNFTSIICKKIKSLCIQRINQLEEIAYLESTPYHETIPSYGDKISKEDWLGSVEDGGFIQSDGHGYWANNKLMSNINCFDIAPAGATCVIWFNK